MLITAAQGVFFNAYFLMYLVSPSFCHRFVGYLEEEAVHTYTKLLEAFDDGKLPYWANMRAPPEAVHYYQLGENASMRDFIKAVRADEACHREVNHHFADMKSWEPVDHGIVTMNSDSK